MEKKDSQILLGNINADHVLIYPIQWERERTLDYHDHNWVTSKYVVSVHPWSGQYEGTLFAEEISAFARDLARLYDTLQGSAEFNPMEQYVTLLIEGDGLGHFEVTGDATAILGSETRLSFSFGIDQTQLKETLKAIESFKRNFPHLFVIR